MPDKLPKGWVKATLGEVNEPSRARALPSDAPDLPYVGMEHVESQTMKLLGQGEASSLKSSSVRFNKGDVLYGKMRPYLNKVWVAEFDGLCSPEFLVFPKRDGLSSQLFAYRLNSQDFVNFADHQVSGDRPRVDFEKLAKFPCLLAPSREQERIVAKLDTLLSRMAAGEAAARRALDRLQRYRAAVLHAAVTGELTRDWRKTHQPEETGAQLIKRLLSDRRARWEADELKRLHAASKPPKDEKWKKRYPEPAVPDSSRSAKLAHGWIWAGWEQVGFSQNGRPFPSNEYTNKGVKLLRPGNLLPDGSVQWNEKNTRCLPPRFERENPDHIIRGNELVINLTAQSLKDEFLGRVCLTSPGENCLLNQRLARLTPVSGEPKFFLYMFKSSVFRRFVDGLNSGSLIQHMFTSQLGDFAFPLPPEAEQAEIVREIERRLAAADRLALTLNRQLKRAQVTRQSLLREAFAGNLVPQNPNEEPASILLERIRAAREAEAKKPKAKRMPKAKSKVVRRSLLAVLRSHKKPISPEQLFRESGFQREFEESEYRHELVDDFYQELRTLTGPGGPVTERRPNAKTVLLEVKP
jgi:type I restriction enzyme S subunit